MLLSIAVVASVSYRAHNEAVRSLFRQNYAQQLLVAKQIAQGLEKDIHLLIRELEILSRLPQITALEKTKAENSIRLTYDYVKQFHVVDIAILDAGGIVRVPLIAKKLEGVDFSFRKYFSVALKLHTLTPTYEFLTFKGVDQGQKGFVLALPIFTPSGDFSGVVLFIIKIYAGAVI